MIKQLLLSLGYEVRKVRGASRDIPDWQLYRPFFSPWLSHSFAPYYALTAGRSLVTRDRCFVLYSLARQALSLSGNFWECGVYKGGTAAILAELIRQGGAGKILRLFDTFEGMPETDGARDIHRQGDFADTSLDSVKAHVGGDKVSYHVGYMPASFSGLEGDAIAFAHIDVDIYRSMLDCFAFIWPRLSQGAMIVVDDYGSPTCPGARQAVDEFFADKPEVPLCLSTGQAVIFAGSPRTTSACRG